MLYTLINTVEPLLMDTLNKGHLSIKDTFLERGEGCITISS